MELNFVNWVFDVVYVYDFVISGLGIGFECGW